LQEVGKIKWSLFVINGNGEEVGFFHGGLAMYVQFPSGLEENFSLSLHSRLAGMLVSS
jgi:hypothetical protein